MPARSPNPPPSVGNPDTEIRPCAPDAWLDHAKVKVGVEIPLTRHFYEHVPARPFAEVDAESLATEERIRELVSGLVR